MSTIAELEARVHQAAIDVEIERHRDVLRPHGISDAQDRLRRAEAALAAAKSTQPEG